MSFRSAAAVTRQYQHLMQSNMRDRRSRRSSARNEAIERLGALKSGALSASRAAIPINVRDMTYQSAIFQASATLEEYIKQIFDHWLFELKRHSLTGANIPRRARFSYFGRELSDAFSKFVHAGDEKDLAERIQGKTHLIEFALGVSGIAPNLTGEFAYKDRKYPSPRNIKKLYERIGCDNIFHRLSREMKSDAELKLRAFNDVRTAIAHGTAPNLTLNDVKRNLDDVALFIKSLDKVNHKEFSRDFGGGVW